MLFLLGQASYYQGPQVSGAYQNGPDKIDILLSHHGGTDFGPAKGISGWEVIGRQGPVEIAGVVRLDAATLRIELASPAPGPLTVRYLYGARPDTSAAVHDNSPMELPLDPFEGVVR